MLLRAKTFLLTNCGGYSATHIEGGWRDNFGTDWEEPGVEIKVTVPTGQVIPEALAAYLRDIFGQKCVALEVRPVEFRYI
jgi:hypothetical protein